MKKWFAYTLYIVVVAIFFLYYLFPSNAFTSYINYQVNERLSGYNLSINQAVPVFPPGLRLDTLKLDHQGKSLVEIEHLKINPVYLSILSEDKIFLFSGLAYDGNIDGQTVITFNSKPKIDLNIEFQGIQIDEINSLKQFIAYEMSGTASGNIIFNNYEDDIGKGTSKITISDSSINFKPSLFGIDRLTFKTIETEFELKNRLILLKRFEIKSRQLSGDAAGSINIKYPINKSRINISGKIKPHPAMLKEFGSLFSKKLKNGGIPFRITGTFDRPNFSLK